MNASSMTMKFIWGVSMLSAVLSQSTQPANSRNVQVADDGTIVATSLNKGPLLLEVPGEGAITIGLPAGILSMDDIAISDEGWLFGLSVYTPVLCSFRVVTASLQPIGCISGNFSLNDYTGLAAKGGACVISGGKNGFTVVDYDRNTGTLSSTLRCLNCKLLLEEVSVDEVDLVEVAMLDSRFASFSVVVNEGTFNGTDHASLVVDLNTNEIAQLHLIPNPIGSSLGATPTNYPCVSDFYRSSSGEDFMFTACGSITVQSVLVANSTAILNPPIQNFQAVSLMVDQNTLVVGGQVMSSSYYAVYSINPTDPRATTLQFAMPLADETILSLAIRNNRFAYVTSADGGITSENLSPAPSQVPSDVPSIVPSVGLQPTVAPSTVVDPTPQPTEPFANNPTTRSACLAMSTGAVLLVSMVMGLLPFILDMR